MNRSHSAYGETVRRTTASFLNLFWSNDKRRWDRGYAAGYWSFLDSNRQSPRHIVIAEMLRAQGTAAASVLDVGCGTGALLPHLPKNVARYVGLDLSSEAIRICRAKYAARRGRSFVTAPFEKYTSAEPFRVIVFNEMLYYYALRRVPGIVRRAQALLDNHLGTLIVSIHDHCPKKRRLWKRLHAFGTPVESTEAADDETGMSWRIERYETPASWASAT